MFIFKTNDCFCFNAQDQERYSAIINNSLRHLKTNIFIHDECVAFDCQSDQTVVNKMACSGFVDFDEQVLANFLLYLYDMAHTQVSNFFAPHNQNKKMLPHMNAIKDTMRATLNKLIVQDKWDIVNLIHELVIQTNRRYLYDFYSFEANYLFFQALLFWFNLDLDIQKDEVFNKIINNHMNVDEFQDHLCLRSLMSFQDKVVKTNLEQNLDFEFSPHDFNIYKSVKFATWFDNDVIRFRLQKLMDHQFLKDIERLNNDNVKSY